MVRTVLQEGGIKPFAIVLHPAEGFMFWSDHGVPKKIERCNMDGTKRKVIAKEDIDYVKSLAIDLDSQRVFWVEYSKNYLSSAKFDGNNRRKNLITQLKTSTSIDIYGQHVYFVTYETGHKAVYKASKVDGSGWTKVFDGKNTLYKLKVFHPSKQLEGYDVCGDDNGGCSHLCLPTSGHTFSCACPNDRDMSSDNFTCLNSDGSVVTSTPRLTTNAPSSRLPFTIPQTNSTSGTKENKNADATVGSSCTHGTLAVVIASVTFIAMVGMLIYNRHLLTRIVASAGNSNPVQRRNCEENMYTEAIL
ncbi:hypothetical protein JTE90_006652 [Oedothorax gibbosus]|uniref:Prolow-density lipoprotein receptor-related protein 1-like beta-propeller domain-containing protein n=1 Tax=Oedothorax gibbosus TaxID=931172 RepID=A0AAV6TS34_9ARAC|nr:hypothetical protein JTE90_006652 [Oedothorax gibbosus]